MKSENKVRHKLKQVRFRHQQRQVRTRVSRRPCNCAFNQKVEVENHPGFHQCVNPDRLGVVCDSNYGGEQIAAQCPFFEPKEDPEDIKVEFDEWMRTADKSELSQEMPDLMALLWVLGPDNDLPEPEDQEPEDQEPEDQEPEDQGPEDQEPEDQEPRDVILSPVSFSLWEISFRVWRWLSNLFSKRLT